MTETPVRLSIAKFKAGSYITIENKKDNDYFFIIREGKVKVSTSASHLMGKQDSILEPGDFFGVISAMTGHPRMETSVAIEDATLIACKKSQFGFLIQKNTPFAMKIIRSFSKDLRDFDQELAKRSTKGGHDEDNPDNLYLVGDYYFNANAHKVAAYIFSRYLSLYPQGRFISQTKECLQAIGVVNLTNSIHSVEFNRTYMDEEMLFSEFEPGNELFIIQKGRVKITKIVNGQELLIAVLNPGDIFGEMSILEDKNRAACAIAFGETRVIAVNKANFEKIVIQQVPMATKLISLLSDRIWTVYRQLANLLLNDPLARMYDTLLTQAMKNRLPIVPKQTYHFTFGAEELIKMIGVEKEEGKEVIKKLLENRHFSIENDRIYCDDTSELRKEVEFSHKMQERDLKLENYKRHGIR